MCPQHSVSIKNLTRFSIPSVVSDSVFKVVFWGFIFLIIFDLSSLKWWQLDNANRTLTLLTVILVQVGSLHRVESRDGFCAARWKTGSTCGALRGYVKPLVRGEAVSRLWSLVWKRLHPCGERLRTRRSGMFALLPDDINLCAYLGMILAGIYPLRAYSK